MADFLSKTTRSAVMSAIRSTGNKGTELVFVSILRAHGINGWRRHPRLVGRPDLVFRKQRLAVFVDGCFWHGCPWHCRMPKSRLHYWRPKIDRNRERDKCVNSLLREQGWRIHRVWEHSLASPDRVVTRLRNQLESV